MFINWKNLLRIFFTLLIVCGTTNVFSQDDDEDNECVRTLRKAQKAYDDGLIETVDNLIRPCLESGQLNKEEQLEGYKLIAMSHTYDGKDELAEAAMLQFLRLDPEYQLQPGVDPKEFSELYSNYHTSPLYTIGLYIGPNWSLVQSYKEFGAYNTENDKKDYKSKVGFQIGLRGTRYIYRGLNVHLDLTYVQNVFSYSQDILESYTNVDPNNEPTLNPTKGVSIESIETHTALSIPLSFSYSFMLQNQIRPYVMAGFETRIILSASNSIQKSPLDPDIASIEIPDIENFKKQRNDLTFAGIFGIGGKYKIKGGDVFVEARYHIGISEQVKRNEIDVNEDERLWNFYQLDNDFTLDNLMFNIGFNKYLYKPRKMKEPKRPKQEKAPKESKEKKSKKNKNDNVQPSHIRQIIE